MLEIFNELEPFFEDNYRRIGVREYAKLKKISPPHASNKLNAYQKEGILLKQEERKYHFFYANRENFLFIKLQQAYYQRRLNGLIKQIEKEFFAPVAILFGSFAKAEINQKSDIDLAVFSATKKKIDLKKFENELQREIQLFTFKNREELKENPELLNNILNGTILCGRW